MEANSVSQKKLLPLFVPIFLETFFLMLAGMVDTLMLSHIGDASVGAVGGSYLFGVTIGLGVFGVFIGLALDEVLRAGFMIMRWLSGKWEKKVLVKTKQPALEAGAES